MNQQILNILALIGSMAVGSIAVLILAWIWKAILKKTDYWLYKYKDKHRFDHPPKAPRYCIQCSKWITSRTDRKSGYCQEFEHWTADNEFCARSYPKDILDYENEKMRIKEQLKKEN